MPINFPQFPLLTSEQASPYGNLIANALQAYQSGVGARYAQPMAQQALLKSQQENIWNPKIWQSEIGLRGAQAGLAGEEAKYYGPKALAEMGLQRAQAGLAGSESEKIKYMLSHPGYMGGDEAKTIEALKDMGILNLNKPGMASQPSNAAISNQLQTQQNAPSSMPFNTGNQMVDAILNKPFAQSSYQQRMAQGFNWVHSPVDVKNYQVAQLAGAGIDPSAAVQQLTSGKTVPEILQEKGFDPTNPPDPDFLPTRGNVQQLKQRQVALKEIDSLGDFVREGLGPYTQTIKGMSPLQVVEAISGQNEDKQAKFLAARMLAPELGNIRLVLANGKAGITAVDQIMNKSMMNVNAYQSLVTPKVFDKAQKLADQALRNSFTKASEAYTVGKGNKNKLSNVSAVWVRDPITKKLVPQG